MNEWLVNNPQIAVWIIGTMSSLLVAVGGGVLSYQFLILSKSKELGEEVHGLRQEINAIARSVSQNLSEVCAASISVGKELDSVRRTLVGTTVVLQRRKAEVAQIRDDAQRARDQMDEIRTRLQTTLQTVQKHERILTRMN